MIIKNSDALWPKVFSPLMISMGTTQVSANVQRVGGVPVEGDCYFCLRWVCRFYGLVDDTEITDADWKIIEALQKEVFRLRNLALLPRSHE